MIDGLISYAVSVMVMALELLCSSILPRGSVVIVVRNFFFFKQKTAYEMRISDWSSDVCSSDLRSKPHFCTATPNSKRPSAKRLPEPDIDMSTQILLPKIGFSMNEGTIAEWLVADGAEVRQGDRKSVV